MKAQMRRDLTPQGYIRHMFAETKNGEFQVGYEDRYNQMKEETRFIYLNWTAEDAEQMEQKYNLLTTSLVRIARVHDQLQNEEQAKALLSAEDFEVWNTYVRPYEPMKVDWDALYPLPPCEPDELAVYIDVILDRGYLGDLIEEEEILLKQYFMWREEQSQTRIPFHRRSCADLIERAARYEKLVSLNAPELVVTEEGRWLAEELVLYYCGKEEPIIWE